MAEKDSEVEKIKHLVGEIASEGTTGWEKLFWLLADVKELSLEDSYDIFALLFDALSQLGEVTYAAFEAFAFFLELCPDSFQPAAQQLDKIVHILSKEILDSGVDDFTKKDSGLLCFSTLLNKFFKSFAAHTGMVTDVFARLSGQLTLYDWMRQGLRESINNNCIDEKAVPVIRWHMSGNPLLYYVSMLATLNLNESNDAQLKITEIYQMEFDRVRLKGEWKDLQKKNLGKHFLNFVKSILFGSIVFPPLQCNGSMIVAELAVLLLPKGEWKDFEYLLLKNLEVDDFERNNEMLLIIGAILEAWKFGRGESRNRFIDELFPSVFKRLNTHKSATTVIRQMLSHQPTCVKENEPERIRMLDKLSKWIGKRTETPTSDISTTIEMKKILSQLIKAEEKFGDNDQIYLEKMKRIAM